MAAGRNSGGDAGVGLVSSAAGKVCGHPQLRAAGSDLRSVGEVSFTDSVSHAVAELRAMPTDGPVSQGTHSPTAAAELLVGAACVRELDMLRKNRTGRVADGLRLPQVGADRAGLPGMDMTA